MPSTDPSTKTAPLRLLTQKLVLVLAAQSAFGLGWSTHLVQPKFLAVELGASPGTIGRVMAVGGLATVLSIEECFAWGHFCWR